jgi:hypothetical protein
MKKYLGMYTADNTNPYMACAVKDCRIHFPHAVGAVGSTGAGNFEWEHVFADDYEPTDKTPTA